MVLNLADFLVQLVMGGAELVSTTLDPHGFFLDSEPSFLWRFSSLIT